VSPLGEFQAQLASDLADHIGCPLRATEAAVAVITLDWDVYPDTVNNGYVAEIPRSDR
jgi:hypothetical protein